MTRIMYQTSLWRRRFDAWTQVDQIHDEEDHKSLVAQAKEETKAQSKKKNQWWQWYHWFKCIDDNSIDRWYIERKNRRRRAFNHAQISKHSRLQDCAY